MIEQLELINFKSIDSHVFNFEDLNLFTGLNGAGKSSIIQSLLLLRQSYEKHLLPEQGVSLHGEYVRIGTGKDLLYIGADKDCVQINLTFSDHSDLHLSLEYKNDSDMQPLRASESMTHGNPFEAALFTPQFQYLSADRISPKATYEVSDYAVNQSRSIGIRGEYTAHFLAVNGGKPLTIKALQHSRASNKTLSSNLDAWMSEITPGTKVNARLIPEINQASLHYQFSSSTELTQSFRPENVGFGLTYVLPVVLAILASKPGDLLVVENPESHLHPGGQSLMGKLVSLASKNGVQIFVETHSDHFFNGIRNAVKSGDIDSSSVNVFYLSRTIETATHAATIDEISIDETGKVEYWPSGFFDQWEKSLEALLDFDHEQ